MDERDKYKFLMELGKDMDELISNERLLLTQKTQLLQKCEAILFGMGCKND
jgi:hypothetical protein